MMNSSKAKRWRLGGVGLAIAALTAGLLSVPAVAVTTTTLNPTADTYVQADRPTENFGTSVRFSTEGRANIWRNSLIRFNVPAAPAGQAITSAKLRLYSETATTATEFIDVYGTSGTWGETTATWNNAPVRSTWLGKQGGFGVGQWVEWDVTNWVGDGGFTNFKLESNVQKWVGFKSKDNTDPALKPQLVVTTDTTTPPPPPTADC